MKMSTLVIVFILLVSVYLYGNKFLELTKDWIQNHPDNKVVTYISGIWGGMERFKQGQNSRDQRAFELVGDTKPASDKASTYSINIPVDWTIARTEVLNGNQVSKTIFTSPTFSLKKEGSNFFYENGAELSIEVTRGDRGGSDHGINLIREGSVTSEQGEGTFKYHVIRDSLILQGEIIDAHIFKGGNTYYIRYAFSPEKFYGGEYTFEELLIFLKFINK
jgi:hypothetical protein